MIRSRLSLLAAAIFISASVAFAQSYKVQSTQGLPGGDVPSAVKTTLNPEGLKFSDSTGKEVAELWLVKSISAASSPDTSTDVIYGAIAPGSLLGVIDLPSNWSDFRGQSVKPGFYTLRYELIPQDGNHMGVSTYRDFALLVPAAQDADPAKTLGFKDVVKLSRLAASTGHPAVLVLDPAGQSSKKYPDAFQDYSQDWAVQAEANVGGKPIPMAFVLIGKYQGE